MNKILLIVSSTVAVGVVTTALAIQFKDYMKDLQERFPEFDKKTIRKAYLKMIMKSTAGLYGDLDSFNDGQMDALFRIEVANVLIKQ